MPNARENFWQITFGKGSDIKKTYYDWGLIPESPPVVPLPKPKTNYVEIPGRLKGPMDLSKVPFGRISFERITGSWNFILQDGFTGDAEWFKTYKAKYGGSYPQWIQQYQSATQGKIPQWNEIFDEIRKWLHGRSTQIVLEEDKTHSFYGRFTVDPPGRGPGPKLVRINYDLEPMRYIASSGAIDSTWVNDTTD